LLNLKMLEGRERWGDFASRAGKTGKDLLRRLGARRRGTLRSRRSDPLLPDDLAEIQRRILRAVDTYVPSPYPGRIILFRARHLPFGAHADPSLGWDKLAGELVINELPGFFGATVLQPSVRHLAAMLRSHLETNGATCRRQGATAPKESLATIPA
jgi:thioesterase domain-containing protein